MAITPIDLQTIFTQVDKVSRAQLAEREGQALSQRIQGAEVQRKTEEQINQINETQNTGEGADKIKDRNPDGSQRQGGGSKEKKNKEEKEAEGKLSVVSNPFLGNKVDISL